MNNSSLVTVGKSFLEPNAWLSSIVVAIVIAVIGLIAGRIAGKLIKRILQDFEFDKSLKKIGVKISIERYISGFISYSIYIIFFLIALNYVGISSLLLNILFVAIIIVLAISLILALRDSLPNVMASSTIRQNPNLKSGKKLTIGGVTGKINEITYFETRIECDNGDIIHIPNSLFVKEQYIITKAKNKEVNKEAQNNKSKK